MSRGRSSSASRRRGAAQKAREEPPPDEPPLPPHDPDAPTCDVCGSEDVMWLACKLICRNCRTMLMSCEDL